MSLFVSLSKQVDLWQAQGLLDVTTADRLRDDIQTRHRGFGIGGVLAILGAVLLGGAVILFVAANWELIPRIWRVALILAVMWGGYLGGAWLEQRAEQRATDIGAAIFAPALYLLAALTYGAGIALVGQMYHMSGDLTTAALAWGLGVLVAAILLRAPILCGTALAIGGFYLYTVLDELSGRVNIVQSFRWILLLYIGACIATMVYTKAYKAMHLVALLIFAYLLTLYFMFENRLIPELMILFGAVLVLCRGYLPNFERLSLGFGAQLAGYGLAAVLIGLFILQFNSTNYADENGARYSLAAIAACVLALIIAGEKSGQLRWFAYTGFSLHVLYLAFATVGTMIGTSGTFLISGLLLMALAYLVTRMERFLRHKPAFRREAAAVAVDTEGRNNDMV